MVNPPHIPSLTAADRADIKLLTRIGDLLDKNNYEAKRQTAATLAAGMIASAGRPHSPAEAVAVFNDVLMALSPASGIRYEKWKEEGRAEAVHA